MQSLYEEFHQQAVQKKQDYAEYRQIRKDAHKMGMDTESLLMPAIFTRTVSFNSIAGHAMLSNIDKTAINVHNNKHYKKGD